MNVVDRLNGMISDVGPRLPQIMGILRRPEAEWLIRLPDVDVVLEYDDRTRRLMLSIELSTVDRVREPETLTRLMQYGFLWRETGCVNVSLNDDLRPVLMVPLFLEEITTDLLANVVAHMVEKARAFTALIEQLATASPARLRRDELKI